jgi:hypothetical protein
MDPKKARESHLRKCYGLTLESYNDMLAYQGGACACCGNGSHIPMHIDHNHKTGKVRGILCHHCNLMLGNAQDDCARLAAGIAYLDRTK